MATLQLMRSMGGKTEAKFDENGESTKWENLNEFGWPGFVESRE